MGILYSQILVETKRSSYVDVKSKTFFWKIFTNKLYNQVNLPKKKIIALSNSKFSQDIVIVYEKTDESPIAWQRMTTSNSKWQWVAANDSGTTNDTSNNGWLPSFGDKNRCITLLLEKNSRMHKKGLFKRKLVWTK